MSAPVTLKDLSPYAPTSPDEDAWLARAAAHLHSRDHVLRLASGEVRDDDEDDPALARGPDGRWWAGRFIGELRFEDRELRIEPRLDIDVIGAWLAHALNITLVPKAATAQASGPLIAQLIDRTWSAALAEASRHGGPRLKRTVEHHEPWVRGRLQVPSTLRHRAARRPLVTSVRSQRDLDNPVSRVIVLADRTLRSLLPGPPTWRPQLAQDLLGQLRGAVGSVPPLPTTDALRSVRYTPITRRFDPVARLSREIAVRRGILTSARRSDASGVLIDVAELWELFLVHCARRAFGSSSVEHGTAAREGTHLLLSGARTMGRLKPDLLIRTAGGASLRAVIDAKYKRLRSVPERPYGVDRGDLYQLAAYLSGHAVPVGALAYPPHTGDTATAEETGWWEARSGQAVRFLRLPATEADCVTELVHLVSGPI